MKYQGSFGAWLKERRRALDLTQFDLANQVPCSVMTIRRIEGEARRPSRQIAERLADALAIAPEEWPAFVAFARGINPLSLTFSGPSDQAVPAHNLPPQPTSFIGRAGELANISAKLANPDCRLLSLIGPGGNGKTRIALEAARAELEHFADGVYFVSLAGTPAATLIGSSIATALNIMFLNAEDPNVQLINYLCQKHMLLVLDNLEHLVIGTTYLTRLLDNSPRLKILVTSRERLNVQEEWVLAVEGLQFPVDCAAAGFEGYPAIQLFSQRAQQWHSNFSLSGDANSVLAICKTFQGMPLGIELAATWLRAMSCRQIAEQLAETLDFLTTPLRNVPERHRSMRAVFDQSWRLLSDQEQAVLMRLSVFRGGFDLDAARQVADANLTILAALVDKSLIRLDASDRYDLHELVRQYGYDKLLVAGEYAETERRHLDYFVILAEEADEHLFRADEFAWVDLLESNDDNMRAALKWASTNQRWETGLRLAAALGRSWRRRCGFHGEGYEWFRTFLESGQPVSPSIRAKALHLAAMLIGDMGDSATAQVLAREAVSIARSIGDKRRLTRALLDLAHALRDSDDASAPIVLLEEGLSLSREMQDHSGIYLIATHLGGLALDNHDYQAALRFSEEALTAARTANESSCIAWALTQLGDVIFTYDSDPRRPTSLYQEALTLTTAARNRWGSANTRIGLATVARIRGDFNRAKSLNQQILATMYGEENGFFNVTPALSCLGAVARAEGDVVQALGFYREALVLLHGLEEYVLLRPTLDWFAANCLAGLGGLLRDKVDMVSASTLLAAAQAIFDRNRDQYAADRKIFDQDVAVCREALSPAAFAAAWEAGHAMTIPQALDYALGYPE